MIDGGYSLKVKRRSVEPKTHGAIPASHPTKTDDVAE